MAPSSGAIQAVLKALAIRHIGLKRPLDSLVVKSAHRVGISPT
jgi:hypothetical protein